MFQLSHNLFSDIYNECIEYEDVVFAMFYIYLLTNWYANVIC